MGICALLSSSLFANSFVMASASSLIILSSFYLWPASMYDAFLQDIEIIIRNVFVEFVELVATVVSSKNVRIRRVFSQSVFVLLQDTITKARAIQSKRKSKSISSLFIYASFLFTRVSAETFDPQ